MWQSMSTCPEGRPVFVLWGSSIFIATRTGRHSVKYEDGSIGRISNLTGWLPCLSWQTSSAPRTGEWIIVTWSYGQRVKLRWKDEQFRDANDTCYEGSWYAWMYDVPDFVPPPKPTEPPNDLYGKSVDEIVSEIKRLTDHLAIVLKSE